MEAVEALALVSGNIEQELLIRIPRFADPSVVS